MALHELATNAIKHGALSNRMGEFPSPGVDDDLFSISWQERGGPRRAPTRRNFGNTVDHAAEAAVRGMSVDYNPAGLRWELTYSAAALSGHRPVKARAGNRGGLADNCVPDVIHDANR
jgi:two-component sensor histidine kinase